MIQNIDLISARFACEKYNFSPSDSLLTPFFIYYCFIRFHIFFQFSFLISLLNTWGPQNIEKLFHFLREMREICQLSIFISNYIEPFFSFLQRKPSYVSVFSLKIQLIKVFPLKSSITVSTKILFFSFLQTHRKLETFCENGSICSYSMTGGEGSKNMTRRF